MRHPEFVRSGQYRPTGPPDRIDLDKVGGDGAPAGLPRETRWDSAVLWTTDPKELDSVFLGQANEIICTERLNNVRQLNRYLGAIHRRLVAGGLLTGNAETSEQRKQRILNKFPRWYAWPYYTLDFVFKRAFPKLKITRWFYLHLTKGRNRVLSKTEVLGRLVYCGFDIVDFEERDNLMHFTARKRDEEPHVEELDRGIVLKLRRIGCNGRPITVYKLRTMHPYAAYLQEFVYKTNRLDADGKFHDDFRIATWGTWLRKLWIDELPMLLNWIRHELKLVGVRPLTPHYLGLYPPEVRDLRLSVKPGLIPPYYADMPANFEEIIASEARYLEAYRSHPFKTDFTYLGRVLLNILLKGARSR